MFTELEADDQMLDTAVAAAIDVFAAGNDIGATPDESVFVHQLGDMGPRTASAARDLAKTLDKAQFDVEIAWRQPSRATRRVTVTAATAAHMAATVEHANLDEQPVEIIGEYLTVSSWLIARGGSDSDTLTVKLGRIDPSQTRGLAVGDRVRINATMKIETTPGGNTKPPTPPNHSKNLSRRCLRRVEVRSPVSISVLRSPGRHFVCRLAIELPAQCFQFDPPWSICRA